jgi:tetratricopeptide (TPR) repeat protein
MTEGVRLFERALDLARRLGDPEALCNAAIGWLIYARATHHAGQRLRLAEDLLSQRSYSGATVRIHGTALYFMADAFLEFGMRERSEACLYELKALAERSKQAHLLLTSLMADTVLATLDGKLEEAVEIGLRTRECGAELGLPEFAAVANNTVGVVPRLLLGRVHEASQVSPGPTYSRLLLALAGRDAEAAAELNRLVVVRPGIGSGEDETWVVSDTVSLEAAVLVRHREATELLLHRLADSASYAIGLLLGPTCVARHLGAAAAFLGKPDEARAYYQEAMDMATGLRFRPEIALTRLQLADLLLEHYPDEKAEALEHLDFAIGEFREMKMQPSLERALKQRENLKV